jgi:hypothetical protein
VFQKSTSTQSNQRASINIDIMKSDGKCVAALAVAVVVAVAEMVAAMVAAFEVAALEVAVAVAEVVADVAAKRRSGEAAKRRSGEGGVEDDKSRHHPAPGKQAGPERAVSADGGKSNSKRTVLACTDQYQPVRCGHHLLRSLRSP